MIKEHWLLTTTFAYGWICEFEYDYHASVCKKLIVWKKCSTTLLQIYNTLLIHYLYLYYCSVNVFYNVFKRFLFFPRFLRFLTFFIFSPTFFTSMTHSTLRNNHITSVSSFNVNRTTLVATRHVSWVLNTTHFDVFEPRECIWWLQISFSILWGFEEAKIAPL